MIAHTIFIIISSSVRFFIFNCSCIMGVQVYNPKQIATCAVLNNKLLKQRETKLLTFLMSALRFGGTDPNENWDNKSLNISYSGNFNPKITVLFKPSKFFSIHIMLTTNSYIFEDEFSCLFFSTMVMSGLVDSRMRSAWMLTKPYP